MKYLYLIIILLTIGCTSNKVSKNHGYKSLELKYQKIYINKSNKNDLIKLIGPPSSKSDFDNNKWFYIERRKTNQSLMKLGIKKVEINNILIVKFNKVGILIDKKIIDKNKMNDVKYVKSITEKDFTQNNFLFNIFTSMREKMNAASKK
tara:strand:- start:176 stop:622 length:447 start_codon:yes stop_codon:yes gene_type:complete